MKDGKTKKYREIYYQTKYLEKTLCGYTQKRKTKERQTSLLLKKALSVGNHTANYKNKLEKDILRLENIDNKKKNDLLEKYNVKVREFEKEYPESKTVWKKFETFK